MKILVALSKVPDTTSKVVFSENNTKYDDKGVQWIINPYDEWYALVRAIELKEKDPSIILHIATVGDSSADPVLRKALALGGDEAIRINTTTSDSYFTAVQLAEVAKTGNYDLIFTGKEAIDFNSSAVGGMLAGLLDLPYLPQTIALEIKDGKATVTREIESGEETDEVALPIVIGATKGLAKQRIPNMRGIMGARSKPLKIVEPVAAEGLTEIVHYDLPKPKAGVKLIEAGKEEELVQLLHEVKAI